MGSGSLGVGGIVAIHRVAEEDEAKRMNWN